MKINFQNKSINYQTQGSGQTLVLLHGFLESLSIWDSFIEILSQEFKVITIDLPGFGNSDNFSESHTMEFMADTVKAVLDHEEVTSCVVAGHSMGGYASLAFAHKYPDLLKGICLFNSQAAADSEEAKTNRYRTIEIIKENRPGFIESFIPDLFAESNRLRFKDQIKELIQSALNISEEGVIAALLGMKERKDSTNLLKSFKKPILFISGKQDKRIPIKAILEQAALPFHSEVLLLENIGHMGFIEAKEKTCNILKTFTQRCYNILPE
ncbi:alpha/beta hydrolase [Desulfosarcina sp.]|nr:alpha/beta hydrolase [Desulfosarcina sp.]